MALLLSFNTVWSMQDLNGLQLDETYYMFTLANTFPYGYQSVYTSLSGTAWNQPIQFLANGTLPVNIFWDDQLTYRIEIRKGNTQSAPLIYLIENYIPNGGNGSATTASNSSDNQITNPQFYNVNFPSTGLTISTASTTTIAPGWQVITTGSGSLAITQLTYTGDQNIVGNPSYGIQFVNTGFNTITLEQTFSNNGALWANEAVGFTLTGQSVGSNPTITANLVSSSGQSRQLLAATLNSGYQDFPGGNTILASTDTTAPASAYTKVQITWTGNTTVRLTNIQLLGQAVLDAKVPYEQITLERQIDHQYHVAYPIVPVGSIIDFGGFSTPTHYLLCDGTAYSRTTYNLLFQALSKTESVSLTSGVATFTVVSSAQYYAGMAITGTGIPASTTILSIAGNTITMSANASATQTSTVTFYAWGAGDGSTTFNVPNLQDYVTAGSGGTLFGAANNAAGLKGGASTVALVPNNLPAHTHPAATGDFLQIVGSGGSSTASTGAPTTQRSDPTTGNNTTTNTPVSIVQQTALVNKYIRYE